MKRVILSLCLGVVGLVAYAADRDPTAPPADAGIAANPLAAPIDSGPSQGSSVLVQNGKPFLVVGTRLFAVGQKVGNAKLERITETEIWLREGGQLTKVQRFAGIQRSVAKPPAPCVAKPAASSARGKRKPEALPALSPQAVTPVAPCEGAQP